MSVLEFVLWILHIISALISIVVMIAVGYHNFVDLNWFEEWIEKNNYVYGIDPDKPRDKYQKGRRFKARVKNITPDKVEIEVEEGVMTARLETRMGVGIGDIVEFEVTDRDEDRITLKHIKQEIIDDKFDMRI